jgi:hypothetical protein
MQPKSKAKLVSQAADNEFRARVFAGYFPHVLAARGTTQKVWHFGISDYRISDVLSTITSTFDSLLESAI